MKKSNFGYTISLIMFVVFQTLSIILKFDSSNTWWALTWLTAIVISSYISTIINLRSGKRKNKSNYVVIFALLTMMLLAVVFTIIGAILGVPECKLPLY